MTKAELVERVAEKINLTKKETERVVNIAFGSIIQALAQGDKVELRGFGSFRGRSRDSRDGRNPRTGATVYIPPKKTPFFKAGKELREMVDHGSSPRSENFPPAEDAAEGGETAAAVSEAMTDSPEEKSF